MPKLKVLSGQDLIRIFNSLGFLIDTQKGSHVKLTRINSEGRKEILTIPNHKELDKGTLKAIIRQSSKYISDSEIKINFYHD